MALSRPTFLIWALATLLAAFVIALHYFHVSVPVVSPMLRGHGFEAMILAFALLWAGTVFKRL
ncbi:MAG: hypothetical protein RLZ98_2027 [Pseudomonadota bacterium]|jgi:hydrogenase-4 membrane subunit HyfE